MLFVRKNASIFVFKLRNNKLNKNTFASGAGGLRFKARPIKSDTVLPTARHRCAISSKGAVLPGRNDAEMNLANSLHASAEYSEDNERFDQGFSLVR